MRVFTAPEAPAVQLWKPRVFLAGSIEQGTATNWQQRILPMLQSWPLKAELTVLNPRRERWDAALQEAALTEQVLWELSGLESADCVLMYLEPNTVAGISLLELGLIAGWNSAGALNRLVVCCPEGFWRRENVRITCNRYHVPVVSTLEELCAEGLTVLQRNHERRLTPLPLS